jgi:hypothetical protein
MGVVVRPPEFAREIASTKRSPARAPRRAVRARRAIRALRAHRIDVQLAALIAAVMALAWILALAGAAFAVRAMLVLCFATLAGRARRVGVPARRAIRIRPQRDLSVIR